MGDSQPGQDDPEQVLSGDGDVLAQKVAIGQVTVRIPLDWRPLPMLALTFGFLPWLIPIVLIVDIACTMRMSDVGLLALLVACSALTECVLKPLIQQPRPLASACRGPDGQVLPGMPSGHVVASQTVATWYALEVCQELPVPQATGVVMALAAFMLAVPWARWYNGDHTLMQVIVPAVCCTFVSAGAHAAFQSCNPNTRHHQAGAYSAIGTSSEVIPYERAPRITTGHAQMRAHILGVD
mmetsp:Transcript_70088/g.193899  ORF Transcript_70088/g.193899 Transcript_70088/m.193899 type:complete len:239 (-) Transcript_70088:47-763(-)